MATNSEKTMDFAPREGLDISNIEPVAPAGAWKGKLKSEIKRTKTSKNDDPMITMAIEITESENPDYEHKTGTTLFTRVIWFKKDSPAYRMGQLALRGLCDKFEIDYAVVPGADFSTFAELDPLVEALTAAMSEEFEFWTVLQKDKNTGEMVPEIRWTAPGGSLSAVPVSDPDDVPAPKAKASAKGVKTAAPAAKAATSKNAKANGKRN